MLGHKRLRAHARGGGCTRQLRACCFVLMLAGECPLFSAWGRFEDGAPAPHEHLRRDGVPELRKVPPLNDEL